MRRFLLVALVALVVVPAALAWRKPSVAERTKIVKGLPAFYHQACIRTTVRVSTLNPAYSSVWFRFVNPSQKGCSPFDGQVIMHRLSTGAWKKIAEGSSWDCKTSGIPNGVVKDVIGTCIP